MRRGNGRRTGLALLAWMLVAAGLRFWQLDIKTPWSDEWATLVFSLGHSFQTIPLDRLLSLEELLAIARLDDAATGQGLGNVWRYLMAESTHPPLYFWLTHLWLRFWQEPGELVGLGIARSLSAWLGVLGVPAAYGLAYVVMAGQRNAQRNVQQNVQRNAQSHAQSRKLRHRVALLTAALMALSPFGVYLAQEARHYTLALLWVMASLSCFILAWRSLRDSPPDLQNNPLQNPLQATRLTWSVTLLWILVNGLGLATHYFVGLLLAAEGLALAGLLVWGYWQKRDWVGERRSHAPSSPRRSAGGQFAKLAAVAGGAMLAALPWLPFWLTIPGDRLTAWISQDVSWLERWLMPLLRLLAWFASMVMLLPVEQVPLALAIVSGLGLLAALVWLGSRLMTGLKQARVPSMDRSINRDRPAGSFSGGTQLVVEALLAVQGTGLALVLAAIYLWQKDLSLATRYFFVFLPGLLLLVAIALARLNQRHVTALLLALSLAGSITVTTGHAFQKPDRPDQFVQAIQTASQTDSRLQSPSPIASPPIIATFYKTHEQLSEMLAVAWELQRQGEPNAHFLITERKPEILQNTLTYGRAVASQVRPFILWESNFALAVDFPAFGCEMNDQRPFRRVAGYRFRGHLCETHGLMAE